MQLDRTAIVISQRSATDLVDLSLLVMRCYWRPILMFAVIGILPFALADFCLLWPLTKYDLLVMSSLNVGDVEVYRIRYLWVVTMTILLQAPIALCGVTYYIGQAVFIERPSIRQVFAATWKRGVAVVLILGILRLSLLSFLPLVLLSLDPIFRPEVEIPFYFLFLCGTAFLVRGFRPFAPEILLLERCPLIKSKSGTDQFIYSKRSAWLHSALSFELFTVHMGVSVAQIMLIASLSLGFMFSIGVLTGIWQWGIWMDLIVYPFIVWGVASWGAVIRFLLYMNSRIRTEGWELELRLKAESHRLEELGT